jgi:hypothetical protein
MFGLGVPEFVIIFIIFAIVPLALIWPAMRICQRAGFSQWLGILIVIPLANIFLLWFVAFSPWPAMAGPDATRSGHDI